MINRQTPAPMSLGSPYIPVSTYTMACKGRFEFLGKMEDQYKKKNHYLSDSDDHAKKLLGAVEESPVLGSVSHLNQLGAGKQLHDESGGDDGGDAKLHEGSSVGRQNYSDPVEGVRRV